MGGGLSLLRVLWLVWAKEYSSLFSELQAAVAQPCLVGFCCSRCCDRPQEQVGSCVQGAQQLSTPCPCPYQDGNSLVRLPFCTTPRWESQLSEFQPEGPSTPGLAHGRPLALVSCL